MPRRSQPGSDLAYFVMIQLNEISAGRYFDDTLRIGEWRTQINVEEFQGTLERKQPIQLLKIVRRAGGQRTEDKRAGFRHGLEGFRGECNLVPCHRLIKFVGRLGLIRPNAWARSGLAGRDKSRPSGQAGVIPPTKASKLQNGKSQQ